MSEQYFIGVDGGGTHSKAVLMSENFDIVRHMQGACLNYYSISFAEAKANFRNLILQLASPSELKNVAGVFIGMSALDHEESIERTLNFSQDLFPHAKVYMDSDLYVALMGHTLGKPGAIVVAGTGAMATALSRKGQVHVVGGYGYLLGDQGSAYGIASDAIRYCLLAFDGIEPATLMQEKLLLYFGIANHRDIIGKVYSSENPRKLISGFSVLVDDAAAEGDACAFSILTQNGRSLADIACSLIRKADLHDISSIGIYGSVLLNSAAVRESFVLHMQRTYPNICIVSPQITPEVGAAIAAVRRCMPNRPIPSNTSEENKHGHNLF